MPFFIRVHSCNNISKFVTHKIIVNLKQKYRTAMHRHKGSIYERMHISTWRSYKYIIQYFVQILPIKYHVK